MEEPRSRDEIISLYEQSQERYAYLLKRPQDFCAEIPVGPPSLSEEIPTLSPSSKRRFLNNHLQICQLRSQNQGLKRRVSEREESERLQRELEQVQRLRQQYLRIKKHNLSILESSRIQDVVKFRQFRDQICDLFQDHRERLSAKEYGSLELIPDSVAHQISELKVSDDFVIYLLKIFERDHQRVLEEICRYPSAYFKFMKGFAVDQVQFTKEKEEEVTEKTRALEVPESLSPLEQKVRHQLSSSILR